MHPFLIRKAIRADVPAIVRLFANDMLGKTREVVTGVVPDSYYNAFDAIDKDPHQQLVVGEMHGKIIGTLQISYITNMSFQGALRALIEGVHVDVMHRNQGIGKCMMEWAILEAKKHHCRFVQLTSNKQRTDAHRFYVKLGFSALHEGFKLDLQNSL